MWKRIFGKKNQPHQPITIVSGLPRSGTSMMMRMLVAGGMEVVVDNIRRADEDNPEGYYEFERVKKIKEDVSWLDDTYGKAFKMVSSLLYALPKEKKYRVICMERAMPEILASQKAMLQRKGEGSSGPDDEKMGQMFAKHLATTKGWLKEQDNIDVIYVSYNDVLVNPRKNVQMVQQFLGTHLDVDKMVEVVDQALYRNRGQL